jgi:hypothetical protein
MVDTDKDFLLLTEQLKHLNTLYKSRFDALDERIRHSSEVTSHRLSAIETHLIDHETRIREATQGVTQFKLFSGLASGGSSVMSIFALLKVLFNI